MKTTVIQLEPHDDPISARDKMSWCRSGRILLVFPEATKILNQKMDLLLLLRYSQTLGAQFAVVSNDPEVLSNAKEIGIPVFESAAKAQKTPWRRLRFRRRIFEQKGPPSRLPEAQGKSKNIAYTVWQSPKLRIAVFAIALLAVISLAWFFIPSAQVTMPMVKKVQNIKLAIRASPSISAVNPSGGIPASVDTLIVEAQDQAVSSGTVVVPDKAAQARVMFTNLTPLAVTVPQGTVLLTFRNQPVRFKVSQSVTIPAGSGQTGYAMVQAVIAGSSGNVSAGAINAFEGSLGLRLIVTNPEAAQGGTDRTAHAPIVSDYAALEKKIELQLSQMALREIQAKLPSEAKMIAGSLKMVSIVQQIREPEVGQPSDTFKLSMRAEFQAWHFQTKDLLQVAAIALDTNLESGTVGINSSLKCDDLDQPQFQDNVARWNVNASRQTERVWDKERIIALVSGRRPDAALQSLISNLSLENNPQITMFPPWWPVLPTLPFRIEVRIQ